MKTLQLILFEYILGYGLQCFNIVFGIYTFNRKKIETKKYLLTSFICTLVTYLMRLLPISFGVHTLFIILSIIFICISLLKMPAITTIRSVSIIFILLIVCEIIGMSIMSAIFGSEKYASFMNDPLQRAMSGFPINLLFVLSILISYYILKKKGDSNRKVSA